MKSIIKTVIGHNWCCQDNRIVRNKSEKQLAFDIKNKSLIVGIKDIRKLHRENIQLQAQDKSIDQGWVQISQNNQVLKDRRKSLLAVHSHKLRQPHKDQNQFQMDANAESRKSEVRKQKIRITCAKNGEHHFVTQNKYKASQGYLKFDDKKRNAYQFDEQKDKLTQQNKRFSLCIKPFSNSDKQISFIKQSQTIVKNTSLTPSKIILKRFSFTPSASISRQKPSNLADLDKKESNCTTVENSQHYSINNLVDLSKGRESLFAEMKGNFDDEANKQNDMNVGNRGMDWEKNKGKSAFNKQQDDKIAQSILIEQNQQQCQQRNQAQITQQEQNIYQLTSEVNHLHKQLNQLKLQESSLLRKLNQDHSEFQVKYKQLLNKKIQCQKNETQRRQQINQIQSLLNQPSTN